MRKTGIIDTDVLVVLVDVGRKRGEMVGECLRVWDSMRGELPPYGEFCSFYVREGFKKLSRKARWS